MQLDQLSPFQRTFYMGEALGESWHSRPTPHHRSSCSESVEETTRLSLKPGYDFKQLINVEFLQKPTFSKAHLS